MLKWAYRYRGGSTLFEAATPYGWGRIYSIARASRQGFETFVQHNGAWRPVL